MKEPNEKIQMSFARRCIVSLLTAILFTAVQMAIFKLLISF